jgi:hypothetical protein
VLDKTCNNVRQQLDRHDANGKPAACDKQSPIICAPVERTFVIPTEGDCLYRWIPGSQERLRYLFLLDSLWTAS